MSGTARFVVLEGGDATGKSTQVERLVAQLQSVGVDTVATFEPGATPIGARLRALVLEGDEPVDPIAEALLMAADRAEHVAEVVRPALARGAWVVSDRFVPSSLAYQGVGRGLGVPEVVRYLGALGTPMNLRVSRGGEVLARFENGPAVTVRFKRVGDRLYGRVDNSPSFLLVLDRQ